MMSIPMRKVHEAAVEYDKVLLATDPRFRGLVIIKGEHDGSSFVFPDAFVVKKDGFYVVFTEHYGTQLFEIDMNHAYQYSSREGIDPADF